MLAKKDLVNNIAEKCGLTKTKSEEFLNVFLTCIKDALAAGEEISLRDFGSFKVKERAERTGRNPQTGAEIKIAAHNAPIFKASKALKEMVNH